MNLSTKTLALLGLAMTNLFWATNAVLARFVVEDIPPFTLVFGRWLLAFLLLLPFTYRDIYGNFAEIRRCWAVIIVLGLLGITIYNSILYLAAHSTTAVNITLVSSTLPLITLVASVLMLKQKTSKWQMLGIAASFTGVAFIISRGDFDQLLQLNLNIGDVLIFGIACCWSIYSVILKKYPIKLPPATLLTVLITAGLPVLAVLFTTEQILLADYAKPALNDLPIFIYIAIFPSILAYLFWTYGVKTVGPNIAALSCYLMPLLTALIAVPLLGEQLYQHHIIGGILILIGLYFGSVFKQKSA
ncbi:MAG: DMT family transporter [Cellvibrionaceae bacterium]